MYESHIAITVKLYCPDFVSTKVKVFSIAFSKYIFLTKKF